MKFTITDIITERTPFGNTVYKATAEDGTNVRASLPNANVPSKDALLTQFNANYQSAHSNKNLIKIGDVIE